MDKNVIPLVSVIMPVYNSEAYVKEAIESILNQSFVDFEFIIINDGSTDKSEEIILSYIDSRIVFIRNAENLKLVATLNVGVERASGQYIARMDSDDIALPERLKIQVDFLNSNPQVGVCGSNVELFGKWNFKTDLSLTHTDIEAELILKNPIFHPTAMFRRSLLEKTGIKYNPSFVHLEDYYFWAELSEVTQMVNLKEVLLKYRWHEENISVTKQDYQFERAKEVILFKLRKILSTHKYSFHSLESIAGLLYLPDFRIKKLTKSEFGIALMAFDDIYKYYKNKCVSLGILKKFSERIEKIIHDNDKSFGVLKFILLSPALKLSVKNRIKLLFS